MCTPNSYIFDQEVTISDHFVEQIAFPPLIYHLMFQGKTTEVFSEGQDPQKVVSFDRFA